MIKVQNLTKTFGSKVAVNGISFNVERGEVLGFLGPNGAGKSTSMRMITGFIPPTDGSVTVGGHDIVQQPIEAKKLIGYLPENAPCYADMTVAGFLSFTAEVRGLGGDSLKRAVHRAAEMCFLENVLHQSVDTLSKGYRHRTCFAQSIIHDPDVLVLDEPTDGLDPNQKHEVRTLIKRMGEKKAIVFSTHILEEVESSCTRAIIIDRGHIVANGTPQELKLKSESAGSVILTISNVSAEKIKERAAVVGGVRRVQVLRQEGSSGTVKVYPEHKSKSLELCQALGEMAQKEHWAVQILQIEEGRLDEVFRSITLPDTSKEASK